jgi:hypothetical protein
MQHHADREHALWSASASSRNFKCPGALALTMHLPETTSEAADWGTCAHQIAERCLRDGGDADRFIGTTEKGKKHSFEVDEEMAETAQMYVDYVRGVIRACQKAGGGAGAGRDYGISGGVQVWVEQRFSLADLNPPFDAGGTGDAVIYLPAERRLEIVDLKGGRGVVVEVETIDEATGKRKINPQLATYALGAMLANKGLDVEQVTVTIVQPRAAHPTGRIRRATIHVVDLMEWAADMMAAMHRAREAMDARRDRCSVCGAAGQMTQSGWACENGHGGVSYEPAMPESAWAATYLSPGDHCRDTFCKAAGTCPALRQAALDAVGVHFSPVDDTPRIANSPDSGSPEERAARLDMLDMIEGWIKEVRAHEHRMAEMGQPAPGYGLVEKTGREKWVEGADDKVREVAKAAALPEDKFLNPGKLRTPKQVREALKKAKADASALAGLSETPKGGTNLVRIDVTTRTVKPAVEQHFTAIQE